MRRCYYRARHCNEKYSWQNNLNISEQNHFLMGYLLSYDEADIKYYYEKMGHTNFAIDRLQAFEFIKNHQQTS